MNDYAEMVSLALTLPTILIGIGVLVHWGPSAWRSWNVKAIHRDASQWLILGVAIGFLGGILDNIYWGIAWSSAYAQHPSRDFWFANGVWPNIPFRQISGAYAAYCHLRSFYISQKQNNLRLMIAVVLSLVVGVAYVCAVSAFRL